MLWPGMKIGQLCFIRLSSPAQNPYGSAAYRLALSGPARPDRVTFSFQNFHRTDVWSRWPTSPTPSDLAGNRRLRSPSEVEPGFTTPPGRQQAGAREESR